ncbi:MAG: hypothetical protein NVSMB27_21370 [Ktedonobacteraceae bacterium]
MKITPDEARKFASGAGFTGESIDIVAAIAQAESGLDDHARNCNNPGGSCDRGILQINSYWHPEVSDACAYDIACAFKEGYRISSQGTNFHPWTTFTNGAYKQFLKGPSPMQAVPQGWSDDGTTLKAPNGQVVVKGFRQWILTHPWDAANLPLEAEHWQDPLEVANPSLGGGSQQAFHWTVLQYTQKDNKIMEMWTGQELLALWKQRESLAQQVQSLQQQLAALQGHP